MFALIDFESGLLTDKRLGIRELKVYIVLAGHADKKTRICWPSRKRISDLTGIHPSNVSVATRKLEKFGYIEKEEFFFLTTKALKIFSFIVILKFTEKG